MGCVWSGEGEWRKAEEPAEQGMYPEVLHSLFPESSKEEPSSKIDLQ
jgi:hypothetical protein